MEAFADLSLQMLRTIPRLALLPLVIVWFGIGEEAKVFLVALGTLFPTYINTVHGIRNVHPKLTEMGRAYGLASIERIRRIVLPGASSDGFGRLPERRFLRWHPNYNRRSAS